MTTARPHFWPWISLCHSDHPCGCHGSYSQCSRPACSLSAPLPVIRLESGLLCPSVSSFLGVTVLSLWTPQGSQLSSCRLVTPQSQGEGHSEHLDSEADTAQGWDAYQASAQTLLGAFSPEAGEIVQS